MLLGVEIYHQLFKGDSIKVCKELPPFYNKELGYVVCGRAECEGAKVMRHPSQVILCSIQTLEAQLKQFWELETFSVKSTYSLEEKLCEQHYCNNTTRLPGGRYSVSLPTKSNITELGKSHIYQRFDNSRHWKNVFVLKRPHITSIENSCQTILLLVI